MFTFMKKNILHILPKIIILKIIDLKYNYRCKVLIPYYEKKLIITPDSLYFLNKLGYLYDITNSFSESIKIYKNILKLNSKSENIYYLLIDALRKQDLGDSTFFYKNWNISSTQLNEISFYAQKLINTFPKSEKAHFIYGNVLTMKGNALDAIKYFHISKKIQLQASRENGNVGLLFIASMPRSGTGFTLRSLSEGLSIPDGRNLSTNSLDVTSCWFPNYIISPPSYATKKQDIPNNIVSSHPSASIENLSVLNLITDKIVVNVRDPRQALLSWIHYMNYFRHTNNIWGVLEANLPDNYFLLSLEKQIDYQIDKFYLPVIIDWIKGWLEAEQNTSFYPEILFTQYEELTKNSKSYFDTILNFYKISKNDFIYPNKPQFKSNTHIRKGKTDEWLNIFTPSQIDRASKMIPKQLYKKFKWNNTTNN